MPDHADHPRELALRRRLVVHYPNEHAARRVMSDARVPVDAVTFQLGIQELWHQCLEQARLHGRMAALERVLEQEFPAGAGARSDRLGGAWSRPPPRAWRDVWTRPLLAAWMRPAGVAFIGLSLVAAGAGLGAPDDGSLGLATRLASFVLAVIGGALIVGHALRRATLTSSRWVHEMSAGEQIVPRAELVGQVLQHLSSHPMVILHGEPGVGRAQVLSQLAHALPATDVAVPFDLRDVSVAAVTRLVASAIGDVLSRLPITDDSADDDADARTFSGVAWEDVGPSLDRRGKRRLVLVFDHADEYIASRARELGVLGASDPSALCPVREDQLRIDPFWGPLSRHLEAGRLRVVCSLSHPEPDAIDALQSLCDARRVFVDRIPTFRFREVVERLLARHPGCITDPDRGWSDYLDALLQEIQRDDRVLPFQLRFALEGLREGDRLTRDELVRLGGVSGLCARRIREVASRIARERGVPADAVSSVLMALLSTDGRRLSGVHGLRAALPTGAALSDDQILAVLKGCIAGSLVRQYGHGPGAVFRVRHEFLVGAIRSLAQPTLDPLLRRLERPTAPTRGDVAIDPWLVLSILARPSAVLALRRSPALLPAWRSFQRAVAAYAAVAGVGVAAYALACDAGFSLPLAPTTRATLDVAGATVFRRPDDELTRAQRARVLRRQVRSVLLDLVTRDGELTAAHRASEQFDAWGHCQLLAALMAAPETGEAQQRDLARALVASFRPPVLVSRDATDGAPPRPFGMRGTYHAQVSMAAPVMWCGAAWSVCERRPACRDALGAERASLRGVLDALLALHRPAVDGRWDGGWSLYPDPEYPCARSVYHGDLALQALIEMNALPEASRVPDARELLRGTLGWVGRGFHRSGPFPSAPWGWSMAAGIPVRGGQGCQDVPREVLLGITQQVTFHLLLADARGLGALPGGVRDRMPSLLAQSELQSPETISEIFYFEDTFRDERGRRVVGYPHPVRTAFLPWTIGVHLLWSRRLREHTSRGERLREDRSADALLARALQLVDPARARTLTDRFYLAELLYVLSAVDASLPAPAAGSPGGT